MEQESKNYEIALKTSKFLNIYKTSINYIWFLFISQIPLPIALFDQEARFLGVNQKFADIYESDALYLFDKLLNTFSTVVYTHFHEAMRYFAKKNNLF